MKKLILAIVFMVSNALLANLSPQKELELINESYANLKSFQITFTHTLYANALQKQVMEQYQGVYIKDGNSCFQRALNSEVLINAKYHIIVSHDEKFISIGRYTQEQEVVLDELPEELVGSLNVAQKLSFAKLNDKENQLSYVVDNSPFKQIMIKYNAKNHFINAIHYQFKTAEAINELGFKEPPYLVVKCKTTKNNKPLSKKIFSERRYAEINGKTVKLNKAYLKYTLYNNL